MSVGGSIDSRTIEVPGSVLPTARDARDPVILGVVESGLSYIHAGRLLGVSSVEVAAAVFRMNTRRLRRSQALAALEVRP